MEFIGIDIFIWFFFIFFILFPMLAIMYELWQRRRYPIRACIIEIQDTGGYQKKIMKSWDRIGDFEQKIIDADKMDRKTGAVVWKLRSNGKMVQNFGAKDISDMTIWWGFRTVRVCFIKAVSGMKGEEFYPVDYSEDNTFKPVYTPDRAATGAEIDRDIEERHRRQSWLSKYWRDLLTAGLDLLIVVMLFLNFLTMKDITTALNGVAGSFHDVADSLNANFGHNASKNTTTAKPNVMGIPYG